MEEFDPEMQKKLDSMAKSQRTVAPSHGLSHVRMDGSGSSMSSTQHRDRYESLSFVDDEGPDHEAQFPDSIEWRATRRIR